jgi:hypothetical protein
MEPENPKICDISLYRSEVCQTKTTRTEVSISLVSGDGFLAFVANVIASVEIFGLIVGKNLTL